MAVNLVTVTGNLETLIGATPSLGRLWFKLNRPDWNLNGDIFSPEYIEAVADTVTGAFSVALQTTDDLEAGASYSVILKYREPIDGKDREYLISNFMLPDGGPYQLGDLLTVPFVEPVPADILALCQAYAVAAAASAAGAAADAVALASAVQFTANQFITTAGVTTYSTGTAGALNVTATNHILFGASPAGPLTYGVDYTVVAGAILFLFTPLADELYTVLSMPRFTNSEAQVILQDYKDELTGPSPSGFGAVCDGVADDTISIRAMHDFCNSTNTPPSYAGVTAIAIQIDAGIVINTDVDFAGTKIKALSGIVATPSFGAMTAGMFIVSDTATPVVTATVAIADTNLKAGSHIPTADFWTDPGYIYIQGASTAAGPLVASRDRLTALTYRQPFCIVKEGRTTYGLATSMEGVANVLYRARRNSARGWISIKNFVADVSTWNNGILFACRRNQVEFSHIAMTGTAVASINRLITHEDCCHQSVHHVTVPAMTSYSSNGTYISAPIGCAEIHYSNIVSLNGWGWQAASSVNGMYLTDSVVNRFDAHDGGFNIYVTNTTLHENGCTFGWGGGDFVIDRVTAFNCPVLQARSDYGGYSFGGNWSISNVIIEQDLSTQAVIVDMDTNPVGCTALVVPMPKTVTISGVVRRTTPSTATFHYICPILHAVDAAAIAANKPPTGFDAISISNIEGVLSSGGWVIRNKLSIDDLTNAVRMTFTMHGVTATRAPTTSDMTSNYHALYIPTKTQIGTSAEFEAKFSECSNLAVDVSGVASTPRLRFSGCHDIRRAKSKTGGRTIIQGSVLNTPSLITAETLPVVGGARSGTTGFTSMIGCQFLGLSAGAGYDLSNVALGGGLLWSSSLDGFVTLPGGVTQATAMSGFRVGAW